MRRLHYESSREVRKRDRGRVAGDTVHFGKDLWAQSFGHVVPDRIFIRELSQDGPSVKDLAAQDSLVKCTWSQQPRIFTLGRAMLPDPGDQIAYESGNTLAGDRFEHVG